jgi:hypothetical protein
LLTPAPTPGYTLSPDLEPLGLDERRALERVLAALTGRVADVLVTAITAAGGYRLVETETTEGRLVVLLPAPIVGR